MKKKINLHSLPDDEYFSQAGIYGLWLMVTFDAVNHLLQYRSTLAETFLFDRSNQFFDAIAEGLDFEPDVLRDHIRKAARRRGLSVADKRDHCQG
jgi:hypothetical protein